MEMRYNPLTDEWVMISSRRQGRPLSGACPLCPGGGELPEDYDLVSFENRFPALRRDPPPVENTGSEILKNAPSKGVCEVVVYTSDHNTALSRMSADQIEKLIYMWVDRTKELSKYDFVKYIFIFENRGKEVGATISHPHGQLYAFPFIPKRIQVKLDSMRRWFEKRKRCVICEVIEEELKRKERIVFENDSFISLVPYYARFPYEVHIYPKRHVDSLLGLSGKEIKDLSITLKVITAKYDKLFEQEFPYMMMLFQSPVNYENVSHFFHFHIEIDPPKRDRDKLKWMASVETGTWSFINPSVPEESAKALREVGVEECP